MSTDERKAVAFLALLLVLAGAARLADRPAAADLTLLTPVDTDSLADASSALLARAERRRRGLEPGERLDPNVVPAEELERLPGVGPALAARIVADREARGAFHAAGDLRRVPGVGAATLERIAPFLTLPAGPGGPAGRGPAGTVPLNHAGVEELSALPGIGPALAARVVAYRDSAGPFRTVDELGRVRGIGPAKLAALRPLVRLQP
jgi:competence ComEA-like helix-hairpin-helix protein